MSTNTVVMDTSRNPGCLLQLAWFALVGWWLGQAWIVVAWLLMLTIIGIPLGVWMLNALPKVIALREPPAEVMISRRFDGAIVRQTLERPQVNILLRALYFVLVGWWLSALWMEAAYAICLTIIGLPIGFWMFDQVPALVSLKR